MIRKRHARIVATLGPASIDKVEKLARAGADVFRMNFSHGTHADHAEAARRVRAAEEAIGRPIALLADLQGPKLRIGRIAGGKTILEPGSQYRLDLDPTEGDNRRAPLPHPEIFASLQEGAAILIDDGRLRLEVTALGADWAEFTVRSGGVLSDRKGVNVPGAILPLSALTKKDYADLQAALNIGVDWVALSFVQKADDMAEVKKLIQGRAAALAKIEKPSALEHLEEIIDCSDGVMVARGDLGVELDPEEVPIAQKRIVRAARRRGIPVIVATQMLDSMISAPTPTRAEASDVANAVYEGADAMMLSAETASGQYPLEAVAMMDRIIARIERDPLWPGLMDAEHAEMGPDNADALSAAARRAGEAIKDGCLVAYTSSGATARRMARERPLQTILALTPSLDAARRLTLGWGLEPRVVVQPSTVDEMTEIASREAIRLGLVQIGHRMVIVAGVPFGTPGSTNLLRMAYAR